jgi:hypothetical protein
MVEPWTNFGAAEEVMTEAYRQAAATAMHAVPGRYSARPLGLNLSSSVPFP